VTQIYRLVEVVERHVFSLVEAAHAPLSIE
jgi:hypothetical protein